MSLLTNIFGTLMRTASLQMDISAMRTGLLAVQTPSLVQSAGFKVRGKPQRRCKDCYVVMRENRKYVICPTHRRHKQMSMVKDEKNTWILSSVSQGQMRPW